jgi:hypothetical protein
MKKIFLLKNLLKQLAAEIHELKAETKKIQKSGNYAGVQQVKLISLKSDFRHRHIAYSLMKGHTYEQIEHPREGNKPDQTLIQRIQNEYAQNVCVSA